MDLRATLQVIADFAHLNLIFLESVNGQLSLNLKDVPWDQALQNILQAKGLSQKKKAM
ncbi:MAG: hypothetical protein EXR35_09380 [Limnohabitans sp.]|nr:hypothetical protein [Limnohabitans sp.]